MSDPDPDTERTASPPGVARPARPDGLPAVGGVLGKYRLTGYLGEGTTSRVYRGRHLRLPLDVAVKVFRDGVWRDPAALAKLRDEACVSGGAAGA